MRGAPTTAARHAATALLALALSAIHGAYLRNGGFVWVDEFWGEAEWANFERSPGWHTSCRNAA